MSISTCRVEELVLASHSTIAKRSSKQADSYWLHTSGRAYEAQITQLIILLASLGSYIFLCQKSKYLSLHLGSSTTASESNKFSSFVHSTLPPGEVE